MVMYVAVQVIRVLIMYAVVIFSLRLMGKRQIGELQPSELVVTIMISELAALPMQDVGIPTISGVIPIIILMFLSIALSTLSLKLHWLRELISGKSVVVVEKGKINQKNLKKLRQTTSDLLEELRLKDAFDLNSVIFAQIETNGKVSVIMSANDNNSQKQGYQNIIIDDGILDAKALKSIGKDTKWLGNELKKRKISDIKDVFLFTADEYQNIFFQKKDMG